MFPYYGVDFDFFSFYLNLEVVKLGLLRLLLDYLVRPQDRHSHSPKRNSDRH